MFEAEEDRCYKHRVKASRAVEMKQDQFYAGSSLPVALGREAAKKEQRAGCCSRKGGGTHLLEIQSANSIVVVKVIKVRIYLAWIHQEPLRICISLT